MAAKPDEVDVHVERDAVQRAPGSVRVALRAHADRGDLGRIVSRRAQTPGYPSSRPTSPSSPSGSNVRTVAMTASSKMANVRLAGRRVIGHGHDRPRDDLTRRVIRDVPAAIGVNDDRVQLQMAV